MHFLWVDGFFFLLLALGGFIAGNLSSLFGLGGGLVLVPLLYGVFHFQGVFPSLKMPMAIGTSLGVMLITTSNVILGRFRRGHIVVLLWKSMFPLIAVGAVGGAILASYLSPILLKWIFVSFLVLVILQAFLKRNFSKSHQYQDFIIPPYFLRAGVSLITGFLSVLLGVGGSVFTLPLFRHAKLPMEYASGTAVALTPAVALIGTFMYISMAWHEPHLPPLSLGYLNLSAFVAVSIGSLLGVPVGLKLSAHLTDSLKAKIYRVLLVLILISMVLPEVIKSCFL